MQQNSKLDIITVRKVQTFMRRNGRFSQQNKQAMQDHWGFYGLEYNAQIFDFKQIFNNDNPVILEIGFGMGISLAQMAKDNPNLNYLGIEVHKPGVGSCINLCANENLTNIRLICHDAIEVLHNCIKDQSISGLQVFFPDPWMKKKHHKRRIIQPHFLQLILPKLKNNAFIHLATDWQNYAEHMLEVMQNQNYSNQLKNQSTTQDFIPRPSFRPLTKFEQRGQRLNHEIWDLYFIKSTGE